ncbi:hypothetical protein [Legionella maioricensis]|uniref:Uncharacterized protein n=1 Tax=Legionella maioricensis TaxID=2896528 RepID=A0A9X2D1V8_9GAMM|nr:hypothetical protein [Legionella maioricensis]MCL9684984.1 hypothetical protein [Legionella maioricensis]MCL9688119.1 hypothetical protein [Legionella maioricensis]
MNKDNLKAQERNNKNSQGHVQQERPHHSDPKRDQQRPHDANQRNAPQGRNSRAR